jgi:hypothetical protein
MDAKMAELESLIGVGKKGSKKAKAANGAAKAAKANEDLSWPDAIVQHLQANRGHACKASDIREAIGCPAHVLTYHMNGLIEEKRVKRVGRGQYQLRGRG